VPQRIPAAIHHSSNIQGGAMFDLSKLGDMAKIAGEAKAMQEKQERMAKEQLEMLQKISAQIDAVISLLKDGKK
jgi:hypothetical protein